MADRELQRGAAVRLERAAAEVGPDGTARILLLPLGLAEMDPEDYRQWELTPEDADAIVYKFNSELGVA